MIAPVYFADVFARLIRRGAEAQSAAFVVVASTGTVVVWDYEHCAVATGQRVIAHIRAGRDVCIFKRAPDGRWRTLAPQVIAGDAA